MITLAYLIHAYTPAILYRKGTSVEINMIVTKQVLISGRVQGVGYRYFTRKNAERLGITGWVKNLPEGTVEAVFQGDENQVHKMMNLVRKGPRHSYVSEIKIKEIEEAEFDDFEVKY